MTTQATINAFYKESLEAKFPNFPNYQDENRASLVTAPEAAERRNSWYLKGKGAEIELGSADDLFELTKLLGTATSEPYMVYYTPQGSVRLVELGEFPAGASTSNKEAIFKQKILPNIQAHYALVLDSPNFDDITKGVLKNWWAENKDSLFEKYILISQDVSEVASLSDVDGADIDIRGVPNNAVKLRVAFFNTLYNKGPSTSSNVLDALGFSQYLRENQGQFFNEVDDPLLTLEGLEQAAKANPGAYARIVTTALGIPRDISEEDLNELNQCALITGLTHQNAAFQFYNYIEDQNYPSSPLNMSGSGNGRIYPVGTINYSPNKLVNNCVISKKIKNIFNTTDNKTPHNMVKRLFWVYQSNEEGAGLREAELSTNSTVHRKKISMGIDNFDGQTSEITEYRFLNLDRNRDTSYYFLENTKITYDGTNPSTARNDVKVEMSWKLGSLEGLDSTLAILGPADGIDTDTIITIKDLITLPITKKPDGSDGPGQFLTNQYSPNYSRLRLKVAPYGDQSASYKDDCMILDLAIIDHQISRSSETGETTLTINYRGYFEATLNMPFNDVLATPKIIENRELRQKESLDKLMENDCKPELIREALRLEQEIFSMESSMASAGSILLRMQQRKLIHSYELDDSLVKAGIFGNVLDGRNMYLKRVYPGSGVSLTNKEAASLAKVQFDRKVDEDGEIVYDDGTVFGFGADDDDVAEKKLLKKIDKRFFFLGDLMWVLTDCLYKDDSAQHRESLRNLNLRFIVGSIFIPDPKNLGGSPRVINPISIPVDLKFFTQWFNATIVNKGITHYPVGTFIRDLVERLVNDVIYDTCFSLLLPDENPPLLRSRTFVGSETRWFKKKNGWFYPNNPYQDGTTLDLLFPKSFVSSVPTNDDAWSQEIIGKNYCVIYQQFPSYKRQLASENNGNLRDDEYCPTIYYGAKTKNYNFLSNVTFQKTNSPYLREARYFNDNYGGLSLLSNVYDLSFSFKRRKANTLFYPGVIINFALMDWGKRWVDEPPWFVDPSDGEITHLFETGILGESDPHREGTMANIMGMGGYFIVKSVEYNLGQTPGEFEINVATKFLGTDATKKLNRTDKKIQDIEHSDECASVFNGLAERFNELLLRTDRGDDPVVKISIESEEYDSGSAERQQEVPLTDDNAEQE